MPAISVTERSKKKCERRMLREAYDVWLYALRVSGAGVDVQLVFTFIRAVSNRVQHIRMLACLPVVCYDTLRYMRIRMHGKKKINSPMPRAKSNAAQCYQS